jgi:hypothetical protein
MEITSEKDKENSLPKQPIENQSNPSYNQTCHRCTELNTLKKMDTQYHIRTNSLISTMYCTRSLDLLLLPMFFVCMKVPSPRCFIRNFSYIDALIWFSISSLFTLSLRYWISILLVQSIKSILFSMGERVQYDNRSVNQLNQNHFNKGNNKITELRTILQRESPNS